MLEMALMGLRLAQRILVLTVVTPLLKKFFGEVNDISLPDQPVHDFEQAEHNEDYQMMMGTMMMSPLRRWMRKRMHRL